MHGKGAVRRYLQDWLDTYLERSAEVAARLPALEAIQRCVRLF